VYVSDTRRAERDFGWQPRVNVDEGVRRLWAWVMALESRCGSADAKRANGVVQRPVTRPNVALSNPSA
jgi:hypothetical protein